MSRSLNQPKISILLPTQLPSFNNQIHSEQWKSNDVTVKNRNNNQNVYTMKMGKTWKMREKMETEEGQGKQRGAAGRLTV